MIVASTVYGGDNRVGLTLIPPGTITNKVDLDIRAGIVNQGTEQQDFKISIYLNNVEQQSLLHYSTITLPIGASHSIKYVLNTTDKVGNNRIILRVEDGKQSYEVTKKFEVIESDIRSTRLIDGAWAGIYHWSEIEGKHWNADIKQMTDAQWHEMVRSMHNIGMDVIVIQEVFRNQEYVGQHKMNVDNYPGKAFYPSELYPDRVPIMAHDPLEAILSEADKLGMLVMMGVGMFAWFDFSAESLEWHKQVAKELWNKYGSHPSFYSFYISEECAGNLYNSEQTYEMQLVRRCISALLQNLDILCPFGFARMPKGDLTGKEAADILQNFCDDAGAHLWFDLEAFLFNPDNSLYPRPIEEIIHDLTLLDNFEKVLCYQYPGVFNDPKMSRRIGEKRTIKLYQQYQKYMNDVKRMRRNNK